VFLAQREDLLLELAERPGDVLERGQGALQQRATARAPDAAPPSRRELGAALAGDAVVVRRHGSLLAAGLRRQTAKCLGATDLLFRHQLLYLIEDLGADAAATRALLFRLRCHSPPLSITPNGAGRSWYAHPWPSCMQIHHAGEGK